MFGKNVLLRGLSPAIRAQNLGDAGVREVTRPNLAVVYGVTRHILSQLTFVLCRLGHLLVIWKLGVLTFLSWILHTWRELRQIDSTKTDVLSEFSHMFAVFLKTCARRMLMFLMLRSVTGFTWSSWIARRVRTHKVVVLNRRWHILVMFQSTAGQVLPVRLLVLMVTDYFPHTFVILANSRLWDDIALDYIRVLVMGMIVFVI